MLKYCGYKLKPSDRIASSFLHDILKDSMGLGFFGEQSYHQWNSEHAFCSEKLYYSELFQEIIKK